MGSICFIIQQHLEPFAFILQHGNWHSLTLILSSWINEPVLSLITLRVIVIELQEHHFQSKQPHTVQILQVLSVT